MDSKSTARSVGTPIDAADSKQRVPQRGKNRLARTSRRQKAAHDVTEYQNLIERITSVHLECSERIDWTNLATRTAPVEPRKNKAEEAVARKALADYEPGRIARMIGRDARKRLELEAAIEGATRKDAEDFRIAHGRWLAKMEDWRRNSGLARRVLAGEPEAKVEALMRFGKFAGMSGIGSNIVVRIGTTGSIEATVTGHGKDIVPTKVVTQLKSGTLSVKKMPKGKFNALHRNHVCSCLIRVANELFSLFPDDEAIVTITDKQPNSATGDLEDVPVVSARVQRETLDALKLNSIDPSEALSSFVHNMSFRKYKGFKAVTKVDSSR